MIILSGVLVVVAIALLVTGIVTGNTGHEVAGLDGLKLIYVSIGVSIISALCLAIGVFLRRKELFGSAEPAASAKPSAASRSGRATRPAQAKARVGAGDAPTVPATPATAVDVPAETSVYVVPGRKRYHLETCRQLAGRDKEELTYVEAREEGFTACTACLPDMALAARAASDSTYKPADTAADESPETGRTGDDPATATRNDLQVTRLDSDTAELEPVAETPAAIPPDDEVRATDTADTARLDQVAEDPEAASEPPAERPPARSRSLFEPFDGGETDSADDSDPAETADTTKAGTGDEEPDVADAGDEHPGDEDDAARPEPAEIEETDSAVREDAEPADERSADEEPAAEWPADEEPEPEPAESSAATEPVEAEAATEADDADEVGDEERPEETAAEAEAADQPMVRILSGTKRYHRYDCALIEDIAEDADDLETLPQAEAKDRGCTPCLVCQPDKDLTNE